MAAIIVGELPQSFNPAVSEWRNPTEFILGHGIVKRSRFAGSIAMSGVLPELKHLSRVRKRKQT